jgi:hypothetical protein
LRQIGLQTLYQIDQTRDPASSKCLGHVDDCHYNQTD